MNAAKPWVTALHAEIEAWIAALPMDVSPESAREYQGRDARLRFLGLKVPSYMAVHKAALSVNRLAEHEAEETWGHVFDRTPHFETRSAALAWFLMPKRYARALAFWPLFERWADHVDNWPHSDTLSKGIARCLELDPDPVLPVLSAWNRSSEAWKQRLSLTCLLYYASGRERVLPFATLLPFIERHLENDHYFVGKAVGWTLRELHNVYPEQTYTFLEANAGRLKSDAFSASTEKMAQDRKDRLKRLRQAARSLRKGLRAPKADT